MRSKFLLAVILLIGAARISYAATGPTITSFTPASGQVGTLITVTGSNLGGPTSFSVGGAQAVIVSNTDTQLVGLVMPGAVTGFVSVSTSGGSVNSSAKFTVTPPNTAPLVRQDNPLTALGLYDSNNPAEFKQGTSVAISADGKTAAVGTSNDQTSTGEVFIWARNTNNYGSSPLWVQQGTPGAGAALPQYTDNGLSLIGSAGSGRSGLGYAVAISADGNTVISGGPYNDTTTNSQTGAVWIFTRTGTTWAQQGPFLYGKGSVGHAHQGTSVALSADGNTALVGAPFDNNFTGATWVFTRNGGTWTQQGSKLVGAGIAGTQPQQGYAVALSADGNTALVGGISDNGSYSNDGVGAVWVFTRSGSVWTQQGSKLVGSGAIGTALEGSSVALSADGNTAMFGGTEDNNYQGAVWAFTRSGGTWTQQGNKLVGIGSGATGQVLEGAAVSLSADGNTALVGAPFAAYQTNFGAYENGALFEFTRTNGTWAQLGTELQGTFGGNTNSGISVDISSDGTTAVDAIPNITTASGGALFLTALPPVAITQAATSITTTGATLNGTVNGNNAATTVTMEYGTAPDLSGSTTATLSSGGSPIPAGTGDVAFTSVLTGLTPATTYYFRINGVNDYGASKGAILSFTSSTAQLQPQTITFPPLAAVNYGYLQEAPGATSTNSTIPITYTSSDATVAIINSSGQIQVVGAGNTTITASQAGNATYSAATPVSQVFKVNPTPLTISADNKSRPYNTANPALTITFGSFANGDTPASLTTQPSAATTATTTSAVGTYPISVSGAVDPNYTFIYTAGTLTITPVAPAATTQPATLLSATGATLNGTVNDDGAATTVQMQYGTVSDLSTSTTVVVTTGVSPMPAGTGQTAFTSVLTGLTPGTTYYFRIYGVNNYGTIYGDILSFTTPQATQTITFTLPSSVTYGVADITPNGTSTNPTIPITYTSSDPAVAIITTNGNIHFTGVGHVNIIAAQAGNASYIATTDPVSITVNPANLTITANNQTKTTGQVNPALTVTYTGFVNNETPANLTVLPTVSTTATTASPAGNYPITATGAADPNYTIFYIAGTLSVTSPLLLTQTITFAPPAPVTYGSADVAPGATSTNNTIPITYTSSNNAVATITAAGKIHILTAGSTIITASQAGNSTYAAATPVIQNFMVNPALLTISANNQNKTYGQANPALTVAYSGFVNGDDLTKLTALPIVSTAAAKTSPAGTYPITITGAVDANYHIIYINGVLTIGQAKLTITATNQTKVYGSANPTLTASYSGFVNGDDSTKLSPQAVKSTTVTTGTAVGTYGIIVSGASDPNYTITYVPGTFKVTSAALTITANNQTKVYGSANPVLTASYSGFVNKDSPVSLTTQPTISTTATTNSPLGNYPIIVTGAVDANYHINYVNGTLTVTAQLAFKPIPPKTYGDPDFNPGATGTGVTYTSSNTRIATIVNGKAHIVGAGTTVITASVTGASISQPLLVNKAVLIITANNQTKTYGTDNPALTLSYHKFVYSDTNDSLTTQPSVNTTANSNSPIGTYPITVKGAASPNYAITYAAGTLTVMPAVQTLTFNPLGSKVYGSADFDPGATASSGEAIIYSSDNTAVANIINAKIHMVSVGTANITATVAPDSNYTNTPSKTQLLTVTQASQTINFDAIADQFIGTTYSLSGVTASSGLPVSFTLSDPTIASINGATLTSEELGTETVTASQPGNADYLPAANVTQTFLITDQHDDLVLVEPVVSPNGDGINDVLIIEGIKNYPDNKMTLINRNGVKIYEVNGYDNVSRVFDGHSNITGVFQQQGTYLYLLEYRVNGELKRKTGFTVLRY